MRLLKIKGTHLPEAVDLYLLAEEWAVFGHAGLSEQTAMDALTAPNSLWYFVVDEENAVIGLCGLERINLMDKVAEPAISLYPSKQRKGLGLKAMQLLCDLADNNLNIRRLQSTVLTNAHCRGPMEKLGFVCEGVLKKLCYKNGKYVDALLYARLKIEDKENV